MEFAPATRIAKSVRTIAGAVLHSVEMIVATLKGKMSDFAIGEPSVAGATPVELSSPQRDALEVLIAWGDSRADAERWLERAAQLHPDVNDASEWVRLTYRVKNGLE